MDWPLIVFVVAVFVCGWATGCLMVLSRRGDAVERSTEAYHPVIGDWAEDDGNEVIHFPDGTMIRPIVKGERIVKRFDNGKATEVARL